MVEGVGVASQSSAGAKNPFNFTIEKVMADAVLEAYADGHAARTGYREGAHPGKARAIQEARLMANVLNRTSKAFIASANTVDYPVAQWIIDPDMSAVAGYPSQYWIITGDVVSLMDQAQRDAVDTAALNAQRDNTSAVLERAGSLSARLCAGCAR